MFENLIKSLNFKNWIFLYIFFELNLIKELGYDTNLLVYKGDKDDEIKVKKINIDGFIYEVPVYLLTKEIPKVNNNILIRKSLHFTRNIIMNKFFIPNNLIFPKSRIILENYFI